MHLRGEFLNQASKIIFCGSSQLRLVDNSTSPALRGIGDSLAVSTFKEVLRVDVFARKHVGDILDLLAQGLRSMPCSLL